MAGEDRVVAAPAKRATRERSAGLSMMGLRPIPRPSAVLAPLAGVHGHQLGAPLRAPIAIAARRATRKCAANTAAWGNGESRQRV